MTKPKESAPALTYDDLPAQTLFRFKGSQMVCRKINEKEYLDVSQNRARKVPPYFTHERVELLKEK